MNASSFGGASKPLFALAAAALLLAATAGTLFGSIETMEPATAVNAMPQAEAAQDERDGARIAAMQALITRMADGAGVTVQSTEALAAENREGFVRAGIRVQAGASFDRAVRLLAEVSAHPDLWLGTVDVRRTSQTVGQDALVLTFSFYTYGPLAGLPEASYGG